MDRNEIGEILVDLYSEAYKRGLKAGADSVATWVGQRTDANAQKTGFKEIVKARHKFDVSVGDNQIQAALDAIIAQLKTD